MVDVYAYDLLKKKDIASKLLHQKLLCEQIVRVKLQNLNNFAIVND